jgi:hypothetical protein
MNGLTTETTMPDPLYYSTEPRPHVFTDIVTVKQPTNGSAKATTDTRYMDYKYTMTN